MRWYPSRLALPQPGQMCLVEIVFSSGEFTREAKAKYFEGEGRWVILDGEPLKTHERVRSWTPYTYPNH
jgi:hypothetical protein